MTCNDDLHDSLVDIGEISCPFCNQNLDSNEKPQDRLVKYESESPEIINDNLMLVCRSCGIVKGYKTSTEYVDFYENRHKMKRKSVYHRKYHVNNVLIDISSEYRITFSVEQKNKIMKTFSEIDEILSQINGERKRMISVDFILMKIFKMLGIESNKLPITKSKKTLASYEKYWKQMNELIGDKMKEIINK